MTRPLIALLLLIPLLSCRPEPASAQSVPDRVRQFAADLESLRAKYRIALAGQTTDRLRQRFLDKLAELKTLDFSALHPDEQVDAVLLRAEIEYRLALLDRDAESDAAAGGFLDPVLPLVEVLQKDVLAEPMKAEEVARTFSNVAEALTAATKQLQEDKKSGTRADRSRRVAAVWAARRLDDVRRDLGTFDRFRNGYDPLYSWWCKAPEEALSKELAEYAKRIREDVVGITADDKDTIIGVPIGADGLRVDLAHEFIADPPEVLIAVARRELAWCEAEMKKAAAEMGLGDDWRAALDATKNDFVPPGEQPKLILDLAEEATKFIEDRDLITIPPLCKEVWRMEMMSPERQRVSPFFTGGPVISISYPTSEMSFDEKMMTMRGNNPHFSRATVHHELIPGHHLQLYMMERHNPHRQLFRTPFWIEGWALYWEMRFWEMDFPRTPKEKMGMLFWRKHRAARIIFSLSYHTGTMTPEECIEFLIENVGFERKNATAEVRRSVMGGYSPLYQAAYMLGGLQLLSLHEEVVGSGKMTEKEFHDFVLRQNAIPWELIRARALGLPLSLDYTPQWHFDTK